MASDSVDRYFLDFRKLSKQYRLSLRDDTICMITKRILLVLHGFRTGYLVEGYAIDINTAQSIIRVMSMVLCFPLNAIICIALGDFDVVFMNRDALVRMMETILIQVQVSSVSMASLSKDVDGLADGKTPQTTPLRLFYDRMSV